MLARGDTVSDGPRLGLSHEQRLILMPIGHVEGDMLCRYVGGRLSRIPKCLFLLWR